MIKASGTISGRPTIMLGLSRKNLERFLEQMGDTYISIKRETLGITFDILIFSGESEKDMAEKFRGLITPETVVHVTDKLKKEGFDE
jgi:hypothetical protein